MKVLVTGATGFVGCHLIPQLLLRGHSVIALARDESKARSFGWFKQIRFIACDIHNQDIAINQLGHPDAVIHLAWGGLPNYKELFHFEENLPAHYRFLKSLVQSGVSQILVTGTCYEYGMQSGCLSEDMETHPANPYGLAKDTLRIFLQILQQQHAFVLQWARLFYMYGPRQSSNSLLAQLDHAIDSKESAFNMSGGEQLRDYLPVEEVVQRLVFLLEHPDCDGIINVCSGKPISVRRLVELHLQKRKADIRLNLGHYPYPDYEPMAFWGSSTKFQSIS